MNNNSMLAETRWSRHQDGVALIADKRAQLEAALQALTEKVGKNAVAMRRCNTMHSEIFDWLLNNELNEPVAGWNFNEFHRSQLLSMGRLSFTNQDQLPVHDHPGSTGLLLVLDGVLTVKQYEVEDQGVRAARVKQVNELSLGAGDFNIFTPEQGNIHMLVAQSESCQVLDIVLSPYKEEERTWYMPLVAIEKDEKEYMAAKLHRTNKTV